MKKLKNALTVCLAIIFASMLIVLPGCSSGKIEVVLWHSWNVEAGEQCHELKVIVDEFNASQNKIKVVLQKQPGNGFSSKVYTAVANGVGPDMIINFANRLPEYIENDLLADMGKYIDIEAYQNRLSETLYQESVGFSDGKLHILPFHESTSVLYYNKTLYEELGLQAPTTWEEVQSNAKTIYEETGITGFSAADSYVDIAQTLFMQTGAEYINKETKTVGFNTEACIEKLEWYVNNVNANYFGTLNFTTGSIEGDFNAGLLGSFIGSCSYYSILNPVDFEYGVVPVPVSGTPWTPIFNSGIIVFGSNEERESAACEFVEYVTNAENSARWCMSTGTLSPYNDANTYDGYTQYIQGNDVLSAAYESLAYSYTTPAVIGAGVVRNELDAAFSQAIGGQKTAREALATAEANCNAALQE